MSLFGSLYSGVSGLNAQSRALGMISDNIANVSTTGYKGAEANFGDLVTSAASRSTYSSGGVQTRTAYRMEEQGLIQGTTSTTDVAIDGGGFFVVDSAANSTGDRLYTRAGSFSPDKNGNLQTTFGAYLQGWKLDDKGKPLNVNTLETVNVDDSVGLAQASSTVNLTGILNSDETGTISQDLTVYDSLGRSQNLNASFTKDPVDPADPSSANRWTVQITGPGGATLKDSTGASPVAGKIVFNQDGTIKTTPTWTTAAAPFTIDWPTSTGAAQSKITFDFGAGTSGLTQLAQSTSGLKATANGSPTGQLTGVSIDKEGFVVASYNNNTTRKVYQLPIATFANPGSLEPKSGNLYAKTDNSGEVLLRQAGDGNAGLLQPSSLEGSTVDIADEFSKMIITQRAYSANTKVISTADQMLDDLIRLK